MRVNSPRQRAIRKALSILVPNAPFADHAAIFEAAKSRHMRPLAPRDAAFLAAVAHIRHAHTDYDDLRADGYDRDAARHFVLDDTNDVLTSWGATRFVSGEEDGNDEDGDDEDGDDEDADAD